jgi:sulfur-oxidizing protein SoxY
MKRRGFLAWIAGVLPLPLAAQQQPFQPPQDIRPLVAAITGGVTPERRGVEVELPQIAENGNSVPIHIRVASPMTPEDHVTAIYIFAERNPRPRVATFHLGPDCPRAEISSRVRLAGTQEVTVLAALSGGRFLAAPVNVLVTSGACLDEGSL